MSIVWHRHVTEATRTYTLKMENNISDISTFINYWGFRLSGRGEVKGEGVHGLVVHVSDRVSVVWHRYFAEATCSYALETDNNIPNILTFV